MYTIPSILGTAFWFASRGIGYLREYTTEEVHSALAVENSGRPLVRVGAEGAAKSAGLTVSASSDPSETCPRTYIKPSTVVVRLKCMHSGCRNRSKEGCPYQYCQQCCSIYIASLQESTDSPLIVTTTSRSGGVSVAKRCPVHKFGIKPLPQQARNQRVNKSQSATVGVDLLPQEAASSSDNPLTPPERTASPALTTTDTCLSNRVSYKCSCKALLIGIGADEQMGGYRYAFSPFPSPPIHLIYFLYPLSAYVCSRHRSVYKAGGWSALERELDADMARIWRRNLGR